MTFFVTFHAAPLTKMHEFWAIVAEHARPCQHLCEADQFDVKFKLHQVQLLTL